MAMVAHRLAAVRPAIHEAPRNALVDIATFPHLDPPLIADKCETAIEWRCRQARDATTRAPARMLAASTKRNSFEAGDVRKIALQCMSYSSATKTVGALSIWEQFGCVKMSGCFDGITVRCPGAIMSNSIATVSP
jgi:hypothetical protein